MASSAIVTTLKGAEKVLDSFLTYHLSIGFDRIYLFFDDPFDPAIAIAEQFQQVEVIKYDEELLRQWEQCRLWKDFEQHIVSEVMGRQCLNVEIALGRALKEGIDWLLHIDVDELFYAPNQSAPVVFKQLSDMDVSGIYFMNYEAVPEKFEISDYFREVNLFRKIYYHLSDAQKKLWNEGEKSRFLSYGGGKSAVRVTKDALPHGVHKFNVKLVSLKEAFPKDIGLSYPNAPIILHYVHCGFSFFKEKFERLGNFNDKWFGQTDIGQNFPLYIEAREQLLQNDESAFRKLYEERILLSNERIEEYLRAGLLVRIEEPTFIMAKA